MIKRNYQLEMEREIAKIEKNGVRPKLLLHSCCAPCSSAVLERLTPWFDITVFYYNTNIAPEGEFLHRSEEQKRLIAELPHSGKIDFLCGNYDSGRFLNISRGLESAPEGGERCMRCFLLRLGETARNARRLNFDYFTTTLSISPLKDAQRLNQIGETLSQKFGVKYLFSDFKKKNGYLRSCELSQEYHLYRQDYCGCIFSKQARENVKCHPEQ